MGRKSDTWSGPCDSCGDPMTAPYLGSFMCKDCDTAFNGPTAFYVPNEEATNAQTK